MNGIAQQAGTQTTRRHFTSQTLLPGLVAAIVTALATRPGPSAEPPADPPMISLRLP